MNELERLQRENRHLRKRIQELEKTIAVITSMNRSPIGADINRSIEISRVLEQQESALLIAELINTVSDKTKMNGKKTWNIILENSMLYIPLTGIFPIENYGHRKDSRKI